MIRVEKIHNSVSLSMTSDIEDKLEENLNEIVDNGGTILFVTECGENPMTNHYTIIYEDNGGKRHDVR